MTLTSEKTHEAYEAYEEAQEIIIGVEQNNQYNGGSWSDWSSAEQIVDTYRPELDLESEYGIAVIGYVAEELAKHQPKTLRELVEEYGANGFIYIDAGNGEGGPLWVEWNEDSEEEHGDTEMYPADPSDMAYEEDDDREEALLEEATFILPSYDQETTEMYVSEWIEGDDTSSNPYKFRIIF